MSKREYKEQNIAFFEEMRKKEGVSELRGGVLYEVIEEGTGTFSPQARSIVTCHYKGQLINGKVFDNTFDRECPEAFRVNDLIVGFQIALIHMHVGDYWRIYIPSERGYGSKPTGGIPGNSTLVFEIKLISIN